jgi:hypothetical protein
MYRAWLGNLLWDASNKNYTAGKARQVGESKDLVDVEFEGSMER